MRFGDDRGVRPDEAEPAGGHARRRLEEEMASRFGETGDPATSDSPAGEPPVPAEDAETSAEDGEPPVPAEDAETPAEDAEPAAGQAGADDPNC